MYLDHEHFPTLLEQRPVSRPITATLYEQGSGSVNEDVVLEADGLFGVFDGATSLDQTRFRDGRTGGRLAAEIAAETFRSSDGSLIDRAGLANSRIAEALRAAGISPEQRHRYWSTSMAVVKVDDDQLHYCQTGDSHILAIYNDNTAKLLSRDIDIDSETLQLWQQAQAPAGTSIHELLAEQIKKVRLQMNQSYGVLNGEDAAIDFLEHGSLPVNNIRHLLLFTDGLLLPQSQPGQSHDWQFMAELFLSGGLNGLHQLVRTLQRQDPQCQLYPRFKCHDDIAAISITFGSSA